MPSTALKNPFPSVKKGSELSYGGCQGWFSDETARKMGCGLAAATDLLIYLHRFGGSPARFFEKLPDGPIPAEIYDYYAGLLRKRYFPLARSFGLNAFLLAMGMDRFFRDNGLPPRARWGVSEKRFWPAMGSMLERDIPVILCVGINFPLPWGKEQLPFYSLESGGYRKTAAAHAHYVTVTGMDEEWLRISSWGREYHLSREEYHRYRKEHSCGLYSNILCL